MQEKSTDELDAQLRNTTPDCMDKYYKENRYYIAETSKAFTYYMKDVIDKKNRKRFITRCLPKKTEPVTRS